MLLLVGCCSLVATAFAQPANDNCANAAVIPISGNGFGLGTFTSASYNIATATVQSGETFASAILNAGLDQKSIWFKFTLPTTRSVKVTLQQPGTDIPGGDAGFAVYKTGNCVPGSSDLSTKFTPIGKFGSTQHPCVDRGDYLVQISSKAVTSGALLIQLDISDTTGATYDHPKEAFDFGTITTNTKQSNVTIECQSLEDATETCPVLFNFQQYSKSTWHTFTTPAYFDFVNVWLAGQNCRFTNGSQTFGYTLYKGDAKTTALSALSPVNACDSLVSDGNIAGARTYRCDELQPNTTYSIQLFYKDDFKDNIRLSVNYTGAGATHAPEPILSKVPASNLLGILGSVSGTTKYYNDFFGCNSRHALHPCPPSLPVALFITKQLTTSAPFIRFS